MELDCTCEWLYLWHGLGRREDPSGMQEHTPAITVYDPSCPVPDHAALGTLLAKEDR